MSITSQSPPNIGNSKPPLVSQSSFGSAHSPTNIVPPSQRIMLNRSGSIGAANSTINQIQMQMPQPISNQLEAILNRHALALLDNFGIRDLAAFSAHLSYDLVAFFRQSTSAFKASPDQFPLILMKLHAQFSWPYPVSSELIIRETPSSSTTISIVDETSSLSSEDVVSSTNGFVIMPTSTNSSTTSEKYATTDFNRKVFEKLCEKSKNRGTCQAEDEIAYIQRQLVKAGSLEWILLFSILRRDVNDLSEALLNGTISLNRLGVFLKCARKGLAKLLDWAENNCVAYSPVLDLFQSFIELAAEPTLLRKISQESQQTKQINNTLQHFHLNGSLANKSSSVQA